jgi:hypothetical protein
VLRALFDMHEWPESGTVNEDTEGLQWVIKVFSSDTLAVLKDTDKEDKEKSLREQWEKNEPGRADKAKRSRMLHLLK